MRFPRELYQVEAVIRQRFPHLRPAQQRGLALWVYGSVLALSACQNAVISALTFLARPHALRQRLREWLYDGPDKAAPCQTQVAIEWCFVPLVRWVIDWWDGTTLALAIDATAHSDRVVALVISVLYRGTAIPIAWHILPANQAGAWMGHILRLLRLIREAIPPHWQVLVLSDRGLWSPRLWKRIRDLGWHPVLRVQDSAQAQPCGRDYQRTRTLVPGPGHAWVGRAVVFKGSARRTGTLLVVWAEGYKAPWVVLTDLPPVRVGIGWYGVRVWIELGFRALKGVGWQWQRTRRTDPTRVARYWLILAVATLWVLACGTRVADATAVGVPPSAVRVPPRTPVPSEPRWLSIFQHGVMWLRHQLGRGRLWRRLWLRPDPLPGPPLGIHIYYHNGIKHDYLRL